MIEGLSFCRLSKCLAIICQECVLVSWQINLVAVRRDRAVKHGDSIAMSTKGFHSISRVALGREQYVILSCI